MIFIICIVVGIIGILVTLLVAKKPTSLPSTAWFEIHPEVLESNFTTFLAGQFRILAKEVIVWALIQYRAITKRVTFKQKIKQRIRTFLSEAPSSNPTGPSEFLMQVKESSARSEKKVDTQLPE